MSGVEKQVQTSGGTVDTIVDSEFQNLCTGIQELMEAQHIMYISQHPLPRREEQANWSSLAFSPCVSKYATSLPIHSYVSTLCEKMNLLIQSPNMSSEPVAVTSPPVAAPQPTPLPSAPPPPAMPAPAQPILPSPPAPAPYHPKTSSTVPKSQASFSKLPVPASTPKQPPSSDKARLGTVKETHLVSGGKSCEPKGVLECSVSSPSTLSASHPPVPSVPEMPTDATPPGTSSAVGGNIMEQIKPDVLCTLMEIMQKNAVRFFIQRGDEESELCSEIKV